MLFCNFFCVLVFFEDGRKFGCVFFCMINLFKCIFFCFVDSFFGFIFGLGNLLVIGFLCFVYKFFFFLLWFVYFVKGIFNRIWWYNILEFYIDNLDFSFIVIENFLKFFLCYFVYFFMVLEYIVKILVFDDVLVNWFIDIV